MLDGTEIEFTFYNSTRDDERAPESRIGKSDLLKKVEVGDFFYILEKKGEVYFHVEKAGSATAELDLNIAEEAAAYWLDEGDLYRRASEVKINQAMRIGKSSQFVRDPNVVAFIKKASNQECQMPDCKSEKFRTNTGRNYIEVHHLIPLSKNGPDTIENCIALCPRCHRLLHHGQEKKKYRKKAIQKMKKVYKEWRHRFD